MTKKLTSFGLKFKILLCVILYTVFYFDLSGQNIIYDNAVYVDYIKTVKLHSAGDSPGSRLTFPTVNLSSNIDGILKLKFDDMEGGFKEYTYKIIHCDKDWNPSDLQEIEFMEGFNDEEIEDFEFSTNGYSEYTNYNLYLPNDNVRWRISGNFLLVITDREMDVPILTRRFIVNEDAIIINSQMIKPRDVLKINSHHEFKLTVNYQNFDIDQPRLELYTTMMQNDNWNSAKSNLLATYERGESIIIDQYDYISFPAIKEFRSFDTRPLSYTTEFVNTIDQNDFETTVLLDLNKLYTHGSPVSEVDANGYFIIDNERFRDPEVSSEYCRVIFNLEHYKELDQDVYIVGAFSDFQARQEYKLDYDHERKLYLGSAYFKQGYYNYMFALKDKETDKADINAIEGSWFETENDYLIIVYYREFGGLYDRILAVQKFNSNAPIGNRK